MYNKQLSFDRTSHDHFNTLCDIVVCLIKVIKIIRTRTSNRPSSFLCNQFDANRGNFLKNADKVIDFLITI